MALAKEASLVLSFKTTTAAMSFEKAAKAAGVKGRLIPLPREISAGCGLAWMSRIAEAEALKQFVENNELSYEGKYELDL